MIVEGPEGPVLPNQYRAKSLFHGKANILARIIYHNLRDNIIDEVVQVARKRRYNQQLQYLHFRIPTMPQ